MSETKLNGLYKKGDDGVFRNVFDGTPLNVEENTEIIADDSSEDNSDFDFTKEREWYESDLDDREEERKGRLIAAKERESEERRKLLQQQRLGRYAQKRRGGVLRYPYQALTAHTDYLQVDIVEYKSVKQSSGSLISNPSSGNRRIQGSKVVGSTRPRGLATKALLNNGSILLPIPNSVQDGNSVDYGSSKLGNLQATAASGIRDVTVSYTHLTLPTKRKV